MKKIIKKSAKKLSVPLALFLVFSGLVSGLYYRNKKRNEPPRPIPYENIAELGGEIERLEAVEKEKGITWQDGYRLGMAYLYTRRDRDAVRTLAEVIRLRPGFSVAYESLGMAYYRLGDFEKAKDVWEKSPGVDTPGGEHIRELIGRAEKKIGYKKRALQLEKIIGEGNAAWEKRYELSTLYIGLGRLKDAVVTLEEAEKESPRSPELYDTLAQVYAMEGDFEKAVKAERKALALKPGDEAIRGRLAEMERLKEALKKGGFHRQDKK
ncbi:MAG: tetratricopeptide repeat protein [Deltaproteobacteria bacterium]|nr:tetratricopeptide repeat protein [Deltaproteobacteria bacterium]